MAGRLRQFGTVLATGYELPDLLRIRSHFGSRRVRCTGLCAVVERRLRPRRRRHIPWSTPMAVNSIRSTKSPSGTLHHTEVRCHCERVHWRSRPQEGTIMDRDFPGICTPIASGSIDLWMGVIGLLSYYAGLSPCYFAISPRSPGTEDQSEIHCSE